MILITGANGHLGGIVIDTLLKKGVPASGIAALVRDENKAAYLKEKGIAIHIGDYDNKPALNEAMKGIDKVLLVSGGNAANGLEQHYNVVDAARNAGVRCIGYTSHYLRDRNTLENELLMRHFQTEDYIIASGMNYLIFRNILYMDSMAQNIIGGRKTLDTGIRLPAGDGLVSYALRSDEAEAIGNVLAQEDCTSRIYGFTNSRSYSFYDVAEALSELSGKPVTYQPISMEAYKEQMKEKGLPGQMVDLIASFITDIKNGQGNLVTSDLEEALGRQPVSLKEGLKQLLGL